VTGARKGFVQGKHCHEKAGVQRVSIDGELVKDESSLPPLLREPFAILTAYNPRSMLLPRRVNETRHEMIVAEAIVKAN